MGWRWKRAAPRSGRSTPRTGATRIFAEGLRNPVGIAFNPASGALWTVVNERDELGNDLVPDYLTSVKQGAFYGWPWSYYGQHVDSRPPANPRWSPRRSRPIMRSGRTSPRSA